MFRLKESEDEKMESYGYGDSYLLLLPREEYKELLRRSFLVDMLKRRYCAESYLGQRDIEDIFGWKKDEEETEDDISPAIGGTE